MDIEFLSKILRELILYNDRVSLPGLGSFIAEVVPSVFSDGGLVIHPPTRRIAFRVSESWNDGILEKRYSKELNVSLAESEKILRAFTDEIRTRLNTRKSYAIPGFGTLRATDQNDYFFVTDKDLFTYIESFGLEPLNIKILQKPGIIEQLEPGPCTGMSEREGASSIDTGEILELDYDGAGASGTDSDTILASGVDMGADADSGIKIAADAENDIAGAGDEPETIAGEVPDAGDQTAVAPKRKISGTLLTILIILGVLLIAAIVLVVFKEEFRPFWEWLLYSEEERNILNM